MVEGNGSFIYSVWRRQECGPEAAALRSALCSPSSWHFIHFLYQPKERNFLHCTVTVKIKHITFTKNPITTRRLSWKGVYGKQCNISATLCVLYSPCRSPYSWTSMLKPWLPWGTVGRLFASRLVHETLICSIGFNSSLGLLSVKWPKHLFDTV